MPRKIGPRLPSGKFTSYTKLKAKQAKRLANSTVTLKQKIGKVIMSKAETKQRQFYQSLKDLTTTTRATGAWADRGWGIQNQFITTNATDILQLIPFIESGVKPNQRLGDKIQPTSLTVHGTVRVALNRMTSFEPTDIKVVIYVLQHVSLKDYNTLYSNNQFLSLLENSENTTVPYLGTNAENKLPVNPKSYRLLKKKIISLRYAGAVSGTGSPPTNVSVANSHNYFADYTLNLSKHLPAQLKFPEDALNGTTLDPTIANSPTNSSIFMCMGFYDQNSLTIRPPEGPVVARPWIEQYYCSKMSFKDL